ncbi:15966_t:CDS:1, partial [Dentiscutata erythropus]
EKNKCVNETKKQAQISMNDILTQKGESHNPTINFMLTPTTRIQLHRLQQQGFNYIDSNNENSTTYLEEKVVVSKT